MTTDEKRRKPGAIISKPSSDKYRDNYERIFKHGGDKDHSEQRDETDN